MSWLVFVMLGCAAGSVIASGLPSVISFDGGGDANGGRDGYLELDYGFDVGPRLTLFLASNRIEGQYDPVVTKTRLLGLRSDPLETVGVGVELEHWGEEDTLTTDTLRFVFDLNLASWSLSLRPQWRTLIFTTDCAAIILANCDPKIEIESQGVAIDVNYFTNGPWSFSLGYAQHEYDRKIEALGQYPIFALIFSAATLDLAAGFEDYRGSVGLSYAEKKSLWSFLHLKSVSKVSGSATFINSLRFSTELDEHWRLHLRIGSQLNELDSDRIGFAGAGLAYSW